MRAGGCLADAPVIALCLNRLRDLKHVAQSLVFDDRGLIDLGQPVVLPAVQYVSVGPQFDTPIRVLPDVDVSINRSARDSGTGVSALPIQNGSFDTA
jgi:hypothetical protein